MDNDNTWLTQESESSLKRLLPRIESKFSDQTDAVEWEMYINRLKRHFPRLFTQLYRLYGSKYDFFYHLESILSSATEMWLVRPAELKALDALRVTDPFWYQSNRMVGAMCYVDLFSDDLQGLQKRIPYLSELGITYLHLMPLFKAPEGENDGGYAISSYREIDPDFGDMEQLAELATELRHHGISLTLDFVFNHTSDEHDWVQLALKGDKEFQEYYRLYPNREKPDAYEKTMPEVFTEDHPGAFTYVSRLKKWVWTTFHTYQWDVNYENPVLFNRMIEEMLFLANMGVEILRLDAVAFIWKQMGTNSQNLPQAHWIVQAFNAIASIAAPAMVFKSEAIVHPDDVREYIGTEECPLSYNPQLMALLWDTLATRDARILHHAMKRRFPVPDGCAWVNYVRCHDDIGWAIADDDIEAIGFNPQEHRHFLTSYYIGKYSGSFARGAPFQVDPNTGQARVSGTCASLAGVEKALATNDETELDLAIRRILLIHGIIITIGGIPLLYLGDEIATLNDYEYDKDPEKTGDSRWLHRSKFDWHRAEQRRDLNTLPGKIFQGLLRLLQLRTQNQAFYRADTEFVETGNKHVFGFIRSNEQAIVFILANFSEEQQFLEARRLRQMGMRKTMIDLFTGRPITATQKLDMEPYQFLVLSRAS